MHRMSQESDVSERRDSEVYRLKTAEDGTTVKVVKEPQEVQKDPRGCAVGRSSAVDDQVFCAADIYGAYNAMDESATGVNHSAMDESGTGDPD